MPVLPQLFFIKPKRKPERPGSPMPQENGQRMVFHRSAHFLNQTHRSLILQGVPDKGEKETHRINRRGGKQRKLEKVSIGYGFLYAYLLHCPFAQLIETAIPARSNQKQDIKAL